MRRQEFIIGLVVLVVFLGALGFFLFRPFSSKPASVQQAPAATSTLGGSIYTKVQAESAVQSSGSIGNPANPFDTGTGAGAKSGYQNPFAQ